jgi:1-acyl-sn-glycerol-3-phosphate acyltransferase
MANSSLPMGSSLLGLSRLIAYLAFTMVLLPAQMAAVALKRPARTRIPLVYHRICARLLGFRLDIRGAMSSIRPTLFVANHSSYLDITVLGGVIPGSFVAKAEVGDWPFFGLLAKLQRTVFVDRRARSALAQREALEERLRAGDNLILFPEGTSSDGNRTLPFKSALFAAASMEIDGRPLTVQPVSVSCTALDGIPLGRTLRSVYAWYGDMSLLSHIWRMVRLGRLTVVVQFHSPLSLAASGSRRQLAERCWQQVADGVACANAGRLLLPEAA